MVYWIQLSITPQILEWNYSKCLWTFLDITIQTYSALADCMLLFFSIFHQTMEQYNKQNNKKPMPAYSEVRCMMINRTYSNISVNRIAVLVELCQSRYVRYLHGKFLWRKSQVPLLPNPDQIRSNQIQLSKHYFQSSTCLVMGGCGHRRLQQYRSSLNILPIMDDPLQAAFHIHTE